MPSRYRGESSDPAKAAALAELRAQIAQDNQPAAPPPTPEPSFVDKMGGIRGLLAGGIRAGTGLLSGEGFLPGAVISGGGELLAEGVEGSLFDPKQSIGTKLSRIGTEAALGLVPASGLIKEGRAAASALRGGVFSGVGEAGREYARGDDLDPETIATSAVLGGTLTGGLSKLLGSKKAVSGLPDIEVTDSAGNPIRKIPQTSNSTAYTAPKDIVPSDEGGRVAYPGNPTEMSKGASKAKTAEFNAQIRAEQGAESSAPSTAQAERQKMADATEHARLIDRAIKNKQERDRLTEIATRKADLEPSDATVRETISGTGPNGEKLSSTRKWAPEAPEEPPSPDPGGFGLTPPPSFAPTSPEVNTLESMFKGAEVTPPVTPVTPKASKAPAGPKKNLLESLAESGKLYDPAIGMADFPKNPAFPVQPELPKELADGLRKIGLPEDAITRANVDMADPAKQDETLSAVRQLLGMEEKPAAPKAPRGKKGAVAPVDVPAPPPAAQVADVGGPTLVKKTGERVPATPPTPPAPLTPGQINRNIAQSTFSPEANSRLDELAKLLKGTKDKATRGPLAKEMMAIKTSEEARLMHGPEAPPEEDWLAKEGREVSGAYDAAKAAGTPVGDVTEIPKPPSGGVTLGSGLGGLQDLLGVAGRNPGLTAHLASGAAGAAIGAATDPLDNPTESAMAGGAAGLAVPSLIKKMIPKIPPGSLPPTAAETVSHAADPKSMSKLADDVMKFIPSAIRGNLLAGPNLPANAIVAPWGSGIMGALEAHLTGDARGTKLLELMHPVEWAKRYNAAIPEAHRLISTAEGASERAGGSYMDSSKYPMKALSLPGVYMTAGDLATRMAGLEAGFTEAEVRAMTATKEPETAIGKLLANVPRTGVAGQVLMPFSRTLVNLTEEGLKRTPGVGFLYDSMVENAPKVSTKQQLLRQLMGAGVAGTSGAVGYNEDIENPTGEKMLRSGVTNAAGPYQLLAAMGYAGGQALKAGDTPLRAIQKAGSQGLQQIPLPSTDIPESYWKFLTTPPGEARKLPAGILPSIFQKPVEDAMKGGKKPLRAAKPHHTKPLKERK